MDNTFKRSIFGGFNRDDVICYIEKTALEAKQRIDELEKENDGLCRQNNELLNEVSVAADARDHLTVLYHNAVENEEARKKSLSDAQQELSSLRAQIASLQKEKEDFLSQIAKLQEQADEYDSVKLHISSIELSARQRAEELDINTRRQLSEMVSSCRTQCNLVISTLGTTCDSISEVLHKLDTSVSCLPEIFHTLQSELEELEKFE